MIEAFAFLAARVHLKIDDEFPETHRSAAEHRVPALHPADPVDVGGGVSTSTRSRRSKLDGTRAEDSARIDALRSRPVGGRAVQVPHLLRHGACGRCDGDRTVNGRSPDRLQPPIKSSGGSGGDPHRVADAIRTCRSRSSQMPGRSASTSTAKANLVQHRSTNCCANNLTCRSWVRDPTPNSRRRSR